jgi:N-acetylglucosamine kinase-like BadF-type ATPase
MTYMMSLDGGGSKVCCLISDCDGTLCGTGFGGAVNSNFNRPDEIEAAIGIAIQKALQLSGLSERHVSLVYCAMPVSACTAGKAIVNSLHETIDIRFIPEFTMSLYAAIQKEEGVLALAGTGSFVFAQTGKRLHRIGGYGSLFSDEGSGYDIGRRALNSCLHMLDEIGPETLLYEQVLESLRQLNYSHIVDIYSFPTGEQRRFIASICKLVGSCAHKGDTVAIGILREAAEILAFQTNCILAKCGTEAVPGFPVTVSGGVWKAHPLMFSTFANVIKQHNPLIDVLPPLFEPVVGGILLGLKQHTVSTPICRLIEIYSDFLYPSMT